MPTVPEQDYWIPLPAVANDRPLGRINPLAYLNPGECGAWVATLQALRALPSTSIVPSRSSPPAPDEDAGLPPFAIDGAGA
jgi:hypothetical protein